MTGAANDGGTDTDTALAVVAAVAGAGTAATSVSGVAACLRLRLRLRLPEPADAVAVDAVAILLGLSCVSHTCFVSAVAELVPASHPSHINDSTPITPQSTLFVGDLFACFAWLLAVCSVSVVIMALRRAATVMGRSAFGARAAVGTQSCMVCIK